MGITATGRRRNHSWPEALKREIVAASFAPGSSVSMVARQNVLCSHRGVHPLNHFHGHKLATLTKKIASKVIVEKLKKQKGIYLFYDSSGSVIYCGRTVKNFLFPKTPGQPWLPRKVNPPPIPEVVRL
jgi:Transposase